jgi:single-strand DNA-binding protein
MSDQPSRNEVTLCGRLAAPVDERELPSGDTLLTARIVIDRDEAALSHSAQRVDTLDCVAWLARVQRTMRAWQAGDRVQVEGSIRRRFFRGHNGPASRVEVEVKRARRLKPPHSAT